MGREIVVRRKRQSDERLKNVLKIGHFFIYIEFFVSFCSNMHKEN